MYIRTANRTDVPAIVALLANDKLGQLREDFQDPLPEKYFAAFSIIDADPNHELMVLVDDKDTVVGTFQLSFLPYLTYQGGLRAQIEAVRVAEALRGKGVGEMAFRWAIDRAKERGAHVLQCTTDKQRPEALRFYEKLGFKTTHDGLKLHFT